MATERRDGSVQSLTIARPEGDITALVVVPKYIDDGAPLAVCVHGSGCTGRYFDLSVNSWLRAAHTAGVPAMAIDRPGHGGSAPGACDPLSAARDALMYAVRALSDLRPAVAERPVVLVGHSFGGAAVLFAAAQWFGRDAELVGLCISGLGDLAHAEYRGASRQDGIPASYWLFGPGRTYDFRGVSALRAASTSWQDDEIAELRERWPGRFPELAAGVRVPVHIRLAEHERIWDASEAGIARIASQFHASPHVNAAILPQGGHLYEMHTRGPELVADQLAFIRSLSGIKQR